MSDRCGRSASQRELGAFAAVEFLLAVRDLIPSGGSRRNLERTIAKLGVKFGIEGIDGLDEIAPEALLYGQSWAG